MKQLDLVAIGQLALLGVYVVLSLYSCYRLAGKLVRIFRKS